MLDEPADTQTGAAPPENEANEGNGWERSSIGFPYTPLGDVVEMAAAIQGNVGSGTMSDDQLAPAIHMSHKSSGYRSRLSAARMFGIIESGDGGHRLSDLGKRIVDEKQARAAKADAFLNVPLYRRVYEEHKGSTIPPAAALEREFLGFGVAPKQTARARQVFERSAEQAAFFEVGKDRLVRPTVRQGDATDADSKTKEDQTKKGKGGEPPDNELHPFIQGLLKTLPPKEGDDWPLQDRVKWLRLAASAFDMIYEAEGDTEAAGQISISVTRSSSGQA
jgi:hypothetical protein